MLESDLKLALHRLGELLDRDVEILVVGGSALLLTHLLPEATTTDDVDLMACEHPRDRDRVLEAAEQVGHELKLPPSWLNDFSGLFRWMLLDDWRARSVLIGTFGHLRVVAPGRFDLILIKLLARRAKDRVHLEHIRPTSDDLSWAIARMKELQHSFPAEHDRIARSIILAQNWANPGA